MQPEKTHTIIDLIVYLFRTRKYDVEYLIKQKFDPRFYGMIDIERVAAGDRVAPVIFGKPALWCDDGIPYKMEYYSPKYGFMNIPRQTIEEYLYEFIEPLIRETETMHTRHIVSIPDSQIDVDQICHIIESATNEKNDDFSEAVIHEYRDYPLFRDEAFMFVEEKIEALTSAPKKAPGDTDHA